MGGRAGRMCRKCMLGWENVQPGANLASEDVERERGKEGNESMGCERLWAPLDLKGGREKGA